MRTWKMLCVAALLAALPAASFLFAAPIPARQAQAASKSTTFTSYQLGSGAVGENCPNATTPCTNGAAEPAIRADGAGTFYGSSENGLGAGTRARKSLDGGLHYSYQGEPDAGSQTNTTGVAPGGGDTDLATAPAKNSAGIFNVYVASLSLANVDVRTSNDGGAT
jgi:hypothetical protein